ncbi:MAG: thioredoxin domain-containing protein, partial [Hyphomicrobium sp.]|nr:thioredoxin domain-containing protein [Hyphomicrobium sp.]
MEQYGRPAFVTVLRSVSEAFRGQPDRIAHNTKVVRDNLSKTGRTESGSLTADLLDSLPPQIINYVDQTDGGLRGAPKFPNTPIFEVLWRAGARLGKTPYRDLVKLTLTRMSQGGIYDHLGGGFARYSTDDHWLVPHFEKMLYDNAQLLELLALCHRDYGDATLRTRATEIVTWLARDMTTPEGAFCASLDADSEGEEGKFYVWTWEQLVSVLGDADASYFGKFYGAGRIGNWAEQPNGKMVTVLNQLEAKPATAEDKARLAPLKEKLFLAREKRVHPGLDDKIMADWNGLMIAAMANAATALGEPSWIDRAARAYGVIADTLQYQDAAGHKRLAHSTRAGVIVKPGFALDHAAMMRAALALHESRHMAGITPTGRDYLADAITWAEAIRDDYIDPSTGLIAMSAATASDVIMRLAPTTDDAIPNAHPVYLTGLIRLAGLTGDDSWLNLADQLLATLAPVVRGNFVGHAGILNVLDLRLNCLEIVTAGPDRKALYEAALAIPFDH